ncbi:MAG: hypothetical protein MJB57_12535 [Gemmatimonadetes bacterium]|nr:hypothetical protein [Gemmatimonadota bacterium]
MRAIAKITIPLGAVALATCAYQPPPAPVVGDPETLGFLAGEWSGEYASEDTGREGNIYFRLRAGADTARGEVLMAPLVDLYGPEYTSPYGFERPGYTIAPPLLTIDFVRGNGPWVHGALDEYRDPECGCMVQTTFTGRIDRDRIDGQFQSRHSGTDQVDTGTWYVRRTGPPPAAEETEEAVASLPPDTLGLTGPSDAEIMAQGRALFAELGCSFCHGADPRAGIAPDLSETLPHREFGWVYRMILRPDSMVRHDPIAKELYSEFGYEMPERGATPWEALVLYEYLMAQIAEEPEPR